MPRSTAPHAIDVWNSQHPQPFAGVDDMSWQHPPEPVALDTVAAWAFGVLCLALLFGGFIASNWRRREP
jgi:hypothetical protein